MWEHDQGPNNFLGHLGANVPPLFDICNGYKILYIHGSKVSRDYGQNGLCIQRSRNSLWKIGLWDKGSEARPDGECLRLSNLFFFRSQFQIFLTALNSHGFTTDLIRASTSGYDIGPSIMIRGVLSFNYWKKKRRRKKACLDHLWAWIIEERPYNCTHVGLNNRGTVLQLYSLFWLRPKWLSKAYSSPTTKYQVGNRLYRSSVSGLAS